MLFVAYLLRTVGQSLGYFMGRVEDGQPVPMVRSGQTMGISHGSN